MRVKMSWIDKRDSDYSYKIKTSTKSFADVEEGSKMLVATPLIIDSYIKKIPFGTVINLSTLRDDLAHEFQVDTTCPVAAAIFLKIVANASYEELSLGIDISEIAPFWRVVDPDSKLAKKLNCGIEFIINQRINEGLDV
tara:strand:- start:170 stop:586 length:417 start_codon:yes stop_codon:yes gene_type:complete